MAFQTTETILYRNRFSDLYRAKVLPRCRLETATGLFVRGVVDRIKCYSCGKFRWNDGTRCDECGLYSHRHHDMAIDQEL